MSIESKHYYELEIDASAERYPEEHFGSGYRANGKEGWDEDAISDGVESFVLEMMADEILESPTLVQPEISFDFHFEDDNEYHGLTLKIALEGPSASEWQALVAESANEFLEDYASEVSVTRHEHKVVEGLAKHTRTVMHNGVVQNRVDGELTREQYRDGSVRNIEPATQRALTTNPDGSSLLVEQHRRIKAINADGTSLDYDDDGRPFQGVLKGAGLAEDHYEQGRKTLSISSVGDKTRELDDQIVVERAWGNTEYYNKSNVGGLFVENLTKVVHKEDGETRFENGYPIDGTLNYIDGNKCTFKEGQPINGTKAMDQYANQGGYLADTIGIKTGTETFKNGNKVSKTRFGTAVIGYPDVTTDYEKGLITKITAKYDLHTFKGGIACEHKNGKPYNGLMFTTEDARDHSGRRATRSDYCAARYENGQRVARVAFLGQHITKHDETLGIDVQIHADGRVFNPKDGMELSSGLLSHNEEQQIAAVITHAVRTYDHLGPQALAPILVETLSASGFDVPPRLENELAQYEAGDPSLVIISAEQCGRERAKHEFSNLMPQSTPDVPKQQEEQKQTQKMSSPKI